MKKQSVEKHGWELSRWYFLGWGFSEGKFTWGEFDGWEFSRGSLPGTEVYAIFTNTFFKFLFV